MASIPLPHTSIQTDPIYNYYKVTTLINPHHPNLNINTPLPHPFTNYHNNLPPGATLSLLCRNLAKTNITLSWYQHIEALCMDITLSDKTMDTLTQRDIQSLRRLEQTGFIRFSTDVIRLNLFKDELHSYIHLYFYLTNPDLLEPTTTPIHLLQRANDLYNFQYQLLLEYFGNAFIYDQSGHSTITYDSSVYKGDNWEDITNTHIFPTFKTIHNPNSYNFLTI
jgi:hypothetical protein